MFLGVVVLLQFFMMKFHKGSSEATLKQKIVVAACPITFELLTSMSCFYPCYIKKTPHLILSLWLLSNKFRRRAEKSFVHKAFVCLHGQTCEYVDAKCMTAAVDLQYETQTAWFLYHFICVVLAEIKTRRNQGIYPDQSGRQELRPTVRRHRIKNVPQLIFISTVSAEQLAGFGLFRFQFLSLI